MESLLTRKQVAQYMSVHPDTIRNWEKKGTIQPATRINDRPRYSKEDVDKLVKSTAATQDKSNTH